tara:strand:- start:524 stop:925 length:402 start_codon:yes stop_codon:yes gene_type:complete
MIKKNKHLFIFISILIISNLITYNYIFDVLTNHNIKSISECFLNNNLDEFVEVKVSNEEKYFSCQIVNNSNCFSINRIEIEIEFYKNLKKDTLKLTPTDIIEPEHTNTVYVHDFELDSLNLIGFNIKKINLVN